MLVYIWQDSANLLPGGNRSEFSCRNSMCSRGGLRAKRDHPATSVKTRILKTQISIYTLRNFINIDAPIATAHRSPGKFSSSSRSSDANFIRFRPRRRRQRWKTSPPAWATRFTNNQPSLTFILLGGSQFEMLDCSKAAPSKTRLSRLCVH